jgi:Golgi nucleoside diphosphatase
MRLLDGKTQDAVLAGLRKGIKENFSFYFPEGHLEIISGKQEGIYQWLAINYVLGKFQHADHLGNDEELVAVEPSGLRDKESLVFRPRTVGALDMGGASMQAAMEITTNLQLEGMAEKDKAQVAEINLGCREHDAEHTYRIFVTTFLGYGANEAMARHQRALFLQALLRDGSVPGQDPDHRLKDPCRALGIKENLSLALDLASLRLPRTELMTGLKEQQTVHFYGTGGAGGLT